MSRVTEHLHQLRHVRGDGADVIDLMRRANPVPSNSLPIVALPHLEAIRSLRRKAFNGERLNSAEHALLNHLLGILEQLADAAQVSPTALPGTDSAEHGSGPEFAHDLPKKGRTVEVAALGSPVPSSSLGVAVDELETGGLPEPLEGRDSDRGEAAEERGTVSDPSAGRPILWKVRSNRK